MSHASKSPQEDPNPPVKRRRGRQPRPSLLNDRVKAAVAAFASEVGQPRVIEPAGFRDFRGWLAFIGGPSAAQHWMPLVETVAQDCNFDPRTIHSIKSDLVREIVKAVVVPREGESSKLVSTNCGRQCARPTSGVTLMTILDHVFNNLRANHGAHISQTPAFVPQNRRDVSHSRMDHLGAQSSVSRRLPQPSSSRYQSSSLPPVNGILPDSRERNGMSHGSRSSSVYASNASRSEYFDQPSGEHGSLPSFRELEDSLQPPLNLRKRGRG